MVYEQNLEIAKAMSLEYPIIQNFKGIVQSNILVEPVDLYYQGSIILSKRIGHLKSMIKKLEEEMDYNPISERSIMISSNVKNTTKPIFFGIVISLPFSFVVIFFRSILK